MALTTRRWIATGSIGCLAIALAYLPPTGESAPNPVWRANVRSKIRQSLYYEQYRLGVLQRRDRWSADLRSTSGQANAGPRILIEDTFPDSVRETLSRQFEAMIQDYWREIRTSNNDMKFLVAATVDTALSTSWNGGELQHYLPSLTGAEECIAAIRLDTWDLNRVLLGFLSRAISDTLPGARLFGPCAFYAMFGQPGAEVASWMARGGYRFANAGARPAPSSHEDPVSGRRRQWWGFDSLSEIGCGTGVPEACREVLFDTTYAGSSARGTASRLYGVRNSERVRGATIPLPLRNVGRSRYRTLGTMQGNAQYMFGDLLAEKGAARFAEFWASSAPVPDAFEQAMGEPLAEWTARWMSARVDPPRRGPSPGLLSAVFGVILAGIATVTSTLVSGRRQVR